MGDVEEGKNIPNLLQPGNAASTEREVQGEEDLLRYLQSLIECPVCLTTIRSSPVLCCPSGHIICRGCKAQLVDCPVCRIRYPANLQLVSHTAASIIDRIPHPCKNRAFGCEVSLLAGAELDEHEAMCRARLVNCPNILCKTTHSLAELFTHMVDQNCGSKHELKLSTDSSGCRYGSVLMTGRARDVDEVKYKVPLLFTFDERNFVVMKKQLGDTLQFYACILGTADQGRQYRVTITIFSDRQAGQSVEYSGNVNSLDGPVWYLLPVHQDLMAHLLDQVEENEYNQRFKYQYKVKICKIEN